jgi:hypothetical protein
VLNRDIAGPPKSRQECWQCSAKALWRPKGYPRATQRLPKGHPREQHQSSTGAVPEQYRSPTRDAAVHRARVLLHGPPLSSTHIEHFALACVKPVMDRLRYMVGPLLPALWLLANGYCFADSPSDGVGDRGVDSILATRQGNRVPIQGSCSFDQSARCWSRRLWHSGPNGLPPFLAGSDLVLPGLLLVDLPPALSDGPFGLAKSWQFYWRTALEPRAPSSVS